jgi:K+-transporting ATPase c subunit
MMRLITGDGSTDAYRAVLYGSALNLSPRVTKVAPYTVVFSTLYDAAAAGAGEISLRENGTVKATGSATDSGVTSFGSQVLYIGRQATAAGYFNGRLYSLIARFSATNLSASTIASAEAWTNSVTKAY